MKVPNPVHCCVCVNLGDQQQRAETIVKGYAVCTAHSTVIDAAESLAHAIDAARYEAGRRNAMGIPPYRPGVM